MEFIKPGTNVNFVGARRYAYTLSLALIIMSAVVLIVRGGPNYGVDFAGGILIHVKFQEPTTPQQVRESLAGLEVGKPTIQSFGEEGHNEFLIRSVFR